LESRRERTSAFAGIDFFASNPIENATMKRAPERSGQGTFETTSICPYRYVGGGRITPAPRYLRSLKTDKKILGSRCSETSTLLRSARRISRPETLSRFRARLVEVSDRSSSPRLHRPNIPVPDATEIPYVPPHRWPLDGADISIFSLILRVSLRNRRDGNARAGWWKEETRAPWISRKDILYFRPNRRPDLPLESVFSACDH